ncbi:hypothetical protein GBA52_020663 [Prunus armeniaca]|nr:hypothetical protein GBA52_020663 [Prunus armeniaca]
MVIKGIGESPFSCSAPGKSGRHAARLYLMISGPLLLWFSPMQSAFWRNFLWQRIWRLVLLYLTVVLPLECTGPLLNFSLLKLKLMVHGRPSLAWVVLAWLFGIIMELSWVPLFSPVISLLRWSVKPRRRSWAFPLPPPCIYIMWWWKPIVWSSFLV